MMNPLSRFVQVCTTSQTGSLIYGCSCTAASITRLVYMKKDFRLTTSISDVPWDLVWTTTWAALELNIGVTCACLPQLRPLFMLHRAPRYQSCPTSLNYLVQRGARARRQQILDMLGAFGTTTCNKSSRQRFRVQILRLGMCMKRPAKAMIIEGRNTRDGTKIL